MPDTDNLAFVPQQELDELARQVRAEHQAVGLAARNMLEHALAAGDALLQAKAKVGYGNWLKYLKDKCDLSEDRAERYMRLAHGREVVEADSARVRNLSLTQALKLIDVSERKGQPRQTDGQKSPKNSKAAKATERLSSLAWIDASPSERMHFLQAVGLDALLAAVPSNWDLRARMLREAELEELWAEVARKTPPLPKIRNSRVTVLGRARPHAGPTLEAKAIPIEETTH